MRKKYLWVWFMIVIITFSFVGCQESDVPPKYPDAEGIEPAVAEFGPKVNDRFRKWDG